VATTVTSATTQTSATVLAPSATLTSATVLSDAVALTFVKTVISVRTATTAMILTFSTSAKKTNAAVRSSVFANQQTSFLIEKKMTNLVFADDDNEKTRVVDENCVAHLKIEKKTHSKRYSLIALGVCDENCGIHSNSVIVSKLLIVAMNNGTGVSIEMHETPVNYLMKYCAATSTIVLIQKISSTNGTLANEMTSLIATAPSFSCR
jgi:hypothetical protein